MERDARHARSQARAQHKGHQRGTQMASKPNPSGVAEIEATKRHGWQAAVKVQLTREIAERTREAIRQSRGLLQRVERILQTLRPRGT
jgi:hypothetical protein